jgi:hypothetical protein
MLAKYTCQNIDFPLCYSDTSWLGYGGSRSLPRQHCGTRSMNYEDAVRHMSRGALAESDATRIKVDLMTNWSTILIEASVQGRARGQSSWPRETLIIVSLLNYVPRSSSSTPRPPPCARFRDAWSSSKRPSLNRPPLRLPSLLAVHPDTLFIATHSFSCLSFTPASSRGFSCASAWN